MSQDPEDLAALRSASAAEPRTPPRTRTGPRGCGRCCVVFAYDPDTRTAARGCAHCQSLHGAPVGVIPVHEEWADRAARTSQESHELRCGLR